MVSTAAGIAGGNKGNAYGQGMKGYGQQQAFSHSFNDMTGYDWAQKSVKTMARMGIIKGEGNGKFAPSRAAKEIEVVAMTLRFLGIEDELDMDAKLPKYYKGTDPDEWMIPYIDAALEEGILLKDEMDDFNPNKSAKRSKAAVYMIRALDMVDEAEDHMDEKLSFKDAAAIPDDHVGYVYLVHDLGLMVGYNDTFQPNKSVTRAELAVLFARMVGLMDTEYSYTMIGSIFNLELSDDEMIELKRGSTYSQFDLDDVVVVYNKDDEEIDLDDLNLKDYVKIYIIDDIVVQIDMLEDDTQPDKILLRRTGELTDINWDDEDPEEIEVLVSGTSDEESFDMDEDAVIKIDGEEESLLEEHIGLEIVFYTLDDEVYKLYVHCDKFEGILDELVYDDEDLVGAVITEEDEDSDEYLFSDEMQVCINDTASDLEDLEELDFENEIEYEVKVKLLGNGNIINLCIDFSEEDDGPDMDERTGELTDITWEDEVITEVEILLSETTTPAVFEVEEDVEIEIDEVEADLTEDHIGLEVTFYTSDDVVYELEVEYDEIEGILNSLLYEDEEFTGVNVTLEDETEDVDYLFTEGVRIFINDEESEPEDLEGLDFEDEIEYEFSAKLLGNDEIIVISVDFEE